MRALADATRPWLEARLKMAPDALMDVDAPLTPLRSAALALVDAARTFERAAREA
jgi:hypothetical protein